MSSAWLFGGPWIVPGNVAKVAVLVDLAERIGSGLCREILDVGIVGLQPLEFWVPLLTRFPALRLTGVDVQGLERAQAVADEHGWRDRVTLRRETGYSLDRSFGPQSFDAVVATQVLEHMPRMPEFMRAAAAVLRPGGELFVTVDSAHWRSRFDRREPARLAKNIVKYGLSLFGDERHYDLPWYAEEVTGACAAAGLHLGTCRYYNLAPVKPMHNHATPPAEKNAVMRAWWELEQRLNETNVAQQARSEFLDFYVRAQRL